MIHFTPVAGKLLKRILLIAAGVLFWCGQAYAVAISSTAAGGSWNAGGSWVGGVVPGAADDVTIVSTAQINLTANALALSLVVDGTLQLGSGNGTIRQLTVSNGVTVSSTGTITANSLGAAQHIINISGGDLTNNGGTFTMVNGVGSVLLNINGAAAQQITGTSTSLSVNNLTVNKGGGSSLTVGGSLTTISANILTLTAGIFNLPTTVSTASNVVLTTGTLVAGTSLSVGGNFTKATAATFTPGTGTVTFNGAGAQTINGTSAAQTFNNIIVNKGGGTLATGGSTVTLNAANVTVTTGAFTGPATFAASGTLSIAAAGTFSSGTNTRVGGDWTNDGGTFNPGVGTVTFNGTGAQTINGSAATQTFNNFAVNKAGGALAVGGSTTTLGMVGYTNTLGDFTGPATMNISGNVVLTAGIITGGTDTNVTGSWTNNGATFNGGTGTVTFNAAVNQSITGTAVTQTFNNIVINKAGGAVAAAGSTTTVNANNFTLTAGTFTAPATFSASGNVLLTAGTFTAGTNVSVGGNWTRDGGVFTPGAGTVTFNGSGSQDINGTVATKTFNNLVVNKSGGTLNASGGTTTINASNLTMTAGDFNGPATMGITNTVTLNGGTLTGGAATTVGLNWTNNGGTFSGGTGTVTFNTAVAQAINGTAVTQSFNNLTVNKAGGALSVGGSTATVTANNLTLTLGTFTAPTTLNLTGNYLQSAGTFTAGTDISVGGNWTRDGGVFTPGTSTVTFNGSGAQDINGTVATKTFANLVVNKSGGTLNTSGGTTAITASNLTMTAGSFTEPATVTLTGNVTLNGGTLTAGANTNVAGNFSSNGGAFTPGTGTVTLNGAGAESLDGSASSQTFNNLIINKAGGTVSSGGSIGTINVVNLTQTLGNFTAPANLNVTGDLLITAGTFTAGSTINLTGNLTKNGGTITPGSGTLNLIGTTQTIGGSSSVTLNSVATTGTTAVSTSVATTLNGNLSMGNGTSLAVGGFNFAVGGTTSVGTGTITIASGGTKTFTGLVTVPASGIWNNSGNSPVTFQGGITSSGTFTAGSGTQTFDTNFQLLTGTFSIPSVDVSGITLINTTSLTVGTALSGTGDLTQATNATLTIGGTSTISGLNATNSGNTVTYNGTSQTINATTYRNLTINQSGATTASVSGATRVNGVLTLTAGNVSLGNNILTLGPAATVPAPVGVLLASGGGEVRKEYSGTGTFTFPIGDNTGAVDSSPIQVNVTAGAFSSAYVSARVVNSKHPDNASSGNFLNRYWIISQSGITGAVANITGTFVGTDVTGTATSAAGAYLAGTFSQTTNPWVKDVALTATTISLSNVPLASGVNTALTGITLAPPTAAIVGGGITVCAGTPVPLNTNVTGDPAFVYSWAPLTGLSSSTIPNPTATPLVTTAYTVTVRDGNGIVATGNTTITVNPSPDVLATPTASVICTGQATSIALSNPNLTPGTAYTWTVVQSGVTGATNQVAPVAGPIAQVLTASGSVPGTATYSIVPVAGTCNGTAVNVVITVNPTPVVTDPSDQIICNGASTVAVNFSGTATAYNWTNDTPSIGLLGAGSGNIASFAATNAGATVVVATVTVTPVYTFGAVTCTGTPQIFTITVNPTPTVVDPTDQVICNGASTAGVTFTGAVAGTVYNWTNDNTSIGLAASGVGNIGVFAGINSGSAPVTATITVTPLFGACAGTPQSFTITVNPTPNVADPVDQVICNGAMTTAVTFAGTVGGTVFNWTNDTGSIGLAGSGSGNIGAFAAVNLGTTAVVATITVTPTTAGPVCTGTPQTFTITVNPTPTVVDPTDQTVCNGAAVAATPFSGAVAGTTYNWTNDTPGIGLAASGSGNIASFTGVNAGAVPVTATVTVTPVFVGCVGTPQTFTITVNPTPTVTDPADQVVCNGANTTAVTFAGTAGATFNWTNDTASIGLALNGSGNIGVFAAVNAGTIPVVATITVTPQTAGPACVGTPQTFTITVNPTPVVTDPSDQIICNGASTVAVNFSGTATAYNWTNDTPSIGLLGAGSGNIASFTATNAGATVVVATVTVTPVYTFGAVTCTGTPQIFTITVNPTPTVVDPTDQVICNGASTAGVTFTGAVAGTVYNWTNDNTSIGLAASGVGNIGVFAGINSGSAPVTATITVTPLFGACAGTPQSFTITVNPTPNVVDPADQVVCNGANTSLVTLTGTVGGTVFNWTNDTGSIGLAGSGSGNIGAFAAVNLGTTAVVATITVTPTTAGPVCTGTPQTFTITVNPTPTVVDPTDQTVCNGAAVAATPFSGTVAGTTYNWTNDTPGIGLAASGSGNIASFTGVNAGAVPVTATVTVTPVFAGCVGTPQTFTITVNPTPTVTDPADQVVCNGANTTAVTFAGTAGATFNWTNDTASIGLALNGSGNIGVFAAVNAGTIPVVATITVTPQTAGPACVGTPQTFTITVNPTPVVTDPSDQIICNGASTVAVNFSGTATAYNWTNDTPSIGLLGAGSGNIASFTATNAGATVVVATVTVTPVYTFGAVTCTGTPQIFTITVNPTPTVVDPTDQVICNGASTAGVTFTGAVAGTVYNWTNDNTSIGLAASGVGNIGVFAGINSGSAPVTATITVTPLFGACAGTPQSFTITVNPTPNVADPVDQVICNGAMTTAVTFAGTVGGTVFNWTNDTGSIGLAGSGSGNIGAFAAVNLGTTAVVATITVTPTTAGPVCTGTPQTFTITVNPTPTVVDPTDQTVCNGAAVAATPFSGAVAGTTYNWTNDTPGIGLAASGSGNIASFTGVNAGAVPVTATVTVTPVFVGCVGTPQTFTITVNPTPTVTDPADQVVCNGANTTAVTFAGTAGATFNWTNDTASIGLALNGSGNIGVFAAVNAGTIPVVATITVTPQTAGPACVGTPQTFTITVNPTPVVTDPSDQIICNGASTVAVNFSGTATAYNWTNDTPSIGLLGAGSGNIASFAATNAGATVVVATVTVTPVYTFGAVTCTGTPQIFTITVNPTPTVVDPTDQVICNGASTAGVTFTGAVAGTVYNWTNDNTSIGLAASGVGNIGVFAGINSGSAPVTATITVTPLFGACAGTPQSFTITVNPTPNVADPVDQVICNGAMTTAVTFAGTVGGTVFNWTNDTGSIGLAGSGSGNIGAFAAVNLGTTAVVATITVTPTTAGPVCTGTPQTFTITVNPTPTVVDPTDQTVCNGAAVAATPFSGAVAGTTYNWTNDTPGIGLAASGSGNIASFTGVNAGAVPVTATVTVTPVFAGCVGTPQTFTITVNPTPTVTDPADQVVCNGANTTAVTFAGTAGATFNWTNDTASIGLALNGSGNIGVFAAVNAGTIPVVATITVTPQTAGPACVGTPQTFTITVNPTPVVTDPSDQIICNGASTVAVNFSGTATAYNWTNDTPSIGLLGAGSGNIASFTATNAGATVVVATVTVTPVYTFGAVTCTGTPQIFTITVNPTPTVVDPTDQVICNGASTAGVTFTGAVAGTVYNWTNDNTSIGLAASGVGNIGVFAGINSGSAPVTATITVTPLFGACAGTPQSFTITVNPTPNVVDPADQVVCNGANTSLVTLTGTVGGTVFNWTNDTGSIGLAGSGSGNIGAFAAVNLGTTAVVATITVTPTTAGPVCTGTPQTFTITVNPTPTVVDPTDQTVCNGAAVAATPFSGAVAGTVYNWTNDTPGIGLAASGSGNIATFTGVNAGAVPVTATVTVTPVFAGCVGTPQTFTITVNPTPTVTDPADQVVCNGANTTAVTFAGTAGATFNWTNDTASIGLALNGSGNIGVFAAVNAGTIPVVATITVTPQTAGPACVGTPQTFTITVNPTPVVTDPSDQIICNGASTVAVNFSGTATAYNWTNDTPSIGLLATGSGNIASFTATNAGATVVVATVTVTPVYTFGAVTCTGTPQIFTITVNPTPTVVDPTDQVICNGASTAGVTFTGAVAGTVYNWTNDTPSIGLAPIGSGNIAAFAANNAGTSPVIATITVTPVFAGCPGPQQTFTITVNPKPVVTAGQVKTICSGAAVNYDVTLTPAGLPAGTTYSWPVPTMSDASVQGTVGAAVLESNPLTITDNLVNITGSPITATYLITPTNGTCVGAAVPVVITINPAPVITAAQVKTICSGQNVNYKVTLTPAGLPAGTTYTWAAPTMSAGGAQGSPGAAVPESNALTILDNLVNTSGASITATYTITPTSGAGCAGAPVAVVITVNPAPVITAAQTKIICSGAAVNYQVTLTPANLPAGTTYTWAAPTMSAGGPQGTSGSAVLASVNPTINDVLVNTTGASITATYTLTPTSGAGCVGAPVAVVITINPAPVVTAGQTKTICSNNAVNYDVTLTPAGNPVGTTYSWPVPTMSDASVQGSAGAAVLESNPLTITDNLVNITGSPITATYLITPTNGTCVGAAVPVVITINPAPVITAAQVKTICSGQNVNYKVTLTPAGLPAGTTYTWAAPTMSAGGAQGSPGAAVPESNALTILDNLVNTSGASITATYTLTPTSGAGCAGAPVAVVITVNPAPVITAAQTKIICSGAAVNYQVTLTPANLPAGTTYTWAAPTMSAGGPQGTSGSAVLASVNPTINDVLVNTTGASITATYTLTPTSGAGCVGAPVAVVITINPAPVVTAGQTKTICSNNAVNYDVTLTPAGNPVGTTYSWPVPTMSDASVQGSAGAAVLESNPLTITDNLVNITGSPITATYLITPTNGTCVGAAVPVVITINPAPVITAAQVKTICSGQNVNYKVTLTPAGLPAGTTYTWAAPTMSAGGAQGSPGAAVPESNALTILDNLVNTSGASITATYTLTPTSGAGCAGAPVAVVITVNPAPVITAAQTKIICSGAAVNYQVTLTPANLPAGTTYTWAAPTMSAGGPQGTSGSAVLASVNPTINDVLVNTTGASITATYTLTPTSGAGCVGAPVAVVITINPAPVVTAGQTKTICSNNAVNYDVTLTPAGNPVGTTYSWPVPTMSDASVQGSAGAAVLESNPLTITDNLVNITGSPITATYLITPTNGTCVGAAVPVVITINPAPVITAAQVKTICSGQNVNYKVTLTPAGLPAGTTYTWAAPTMSAGGAQGSPGAAVPESNALTILDNLVNTSGASITATYTLTPTSGAGCAGAPVAVVITVNPAPVITAAQTKIICSGAAVNYQVTLTPANLPAGTTYTWAAPTMSAGGPQGTSGSAVLASVNPTINDVLVNTTGASITATYTLTPTSGAGCVGAPVAVVITINPAPVVTAGQTKTICSNNAVNYDVTLTPAGNPVGTTYSWPVPTMSDASVQGTVGAAVLESNPLTITDNLVNITGSPITATYLITPTNGTCVGAAVPVVITINPAPVITAAQVKTICSGQNVNYKVTLTPAGLPAGTTYTWAAPTMSAGGAQGSPGAAVPESNALTILDNLVNTSGASITATYTLTPTSGAGCAGAPVAVVITVNPAPVITAAQTKIICSGAAVNYQVTLTPANLPAGTTYTWAAPTMSAGGPQGTSGSAVLATVNPTINDILTNTTGASITATYTLTPTSGAGCVGAPVAVVITINPAPVVTAGQTKTICSNNAVNYDVTLTPAGNPAGTTYSWPVPTMSDASVQGSAGAAVLESNPLTITDILVNTGPVAITATYNIVPTNGTCTGASVPVVITVNPVPVGNPVLSASCSDVAIGSANVLTTTAGSVSAANFTISTNPNGLTQSAGTVSAGTLKGPNELIDDAWTNTTGSDVNVVYTVTPFSSVGCPGANFTVTATIHPEPVSGPIAASAVCSDIATGYTLSTPLAATYNISTNSNGLAQSAGTISAGNGKLAAELADDKWTNINNAFPSIDVVYTVTPLTALGCAGNPFTVTVPVKPEPRGGNASIAICSSISSTPVNYDLQTTNVNGLGNGMASTFSWIVPVDNTNVSGESLTAQAGSVISDILVNPTGVDQIITYQVTPTGSVSGCVGDVFTVTVTVKPSPIGVNQSVNTCSDVAANYNLLNNVAILGNNQGSTFSWVAASNTFVTGESTSPVVGPRITDVITNVTNIDQIVDYTITPTGVNGCVGANFMIQFTVKPEPVGSTVFAPDICSGNPVNYNLQTNVNLSNGLASNFLWTATANPNVSGDNVFAQTSPVIGDVLTNNIFVVQIVQYNITPTGVNGCAGNPFNISVNINPGAQISAGPDLVICSSQPTEILQGTVTFAPNGVSWARVTPSTETYAPSNLVGNPVYTHNSVVPADGVVVHNLVLTALDPDGPGPCLTVTDAMTLQINGLPFLNVTGLPTSIAENKPPVPVTANRVGGNFFVSAGSALPPQYVNGGVDEVLFDPSLAALNQNDTVYFTWQNPVNLCRDTVQRVVFVSPVTTIDFGMEYPCSPGPCTPLSIARDVASNEFRLCSNSGIVHLVGSPPAPNGDPSGTSFESVPTAVDPTGAILQAKLSAVTNEWFLDTNGLPSGDYRLQYNYRENFPPFNDATPISYVVKIWAAPDAVISAPANNCNSAGVPMNSTSFIIGDPAQNPFGATITSHFWTFGGGNPPGFASGPSVVQTYPIAGLYTVTLIVTTNNLCRDTDTFAVQVGEPPVVDFDWAAICTNDLTNFTDLTNPGISTIVNYGWDFGDGNLISGVPAGAAPEGGTHKDPKHNYTSSNIWNVTLTVTTNDNCTNTINKPVPILTGGSTVAPTPAAPYTNDFNASPGSWIPQRLDTGTQISWIWGIPSGLNITSPDKGWWTGYKKFNGLDSTYWDYEQSAVNGPCFDLTNLQRPMLELDYWADAERNTDGAVVQYSINGGLSWSLVGPLQGQPRDQGINWYDPTALITSDPGQQVRKYFSIGSYGWTDKSGQWKRAKFSLDNVPVASRSQVRVRIAFSSNDQNAFGAQYDGFAFDNILVGEKARRVLVENFTNSPTAPSIDQTQLTLRYNSQVSLRGPGGSDFYYVNYHIGYPTPDPLNLENPADPGARGLFMSVSQSQTIIDGIIDNVRFTGSFTDLDANGIEADRRAMVNPQFDLVLDTVATSNQNTIKAKLTMTARQASTDPLLVQVLLVEDQTGTYPYRNVVRKQLLGADGVTVSQTFALNDVRVETGNEVTINVPITNSGMLTLIGYVQNKITREIYQTVILPAPIKKGILVVGLEDKPIPSTLNGITLYPNPANGKVFLGTPEHAPMDGFSWKLIDQRGVVVKSGDFTELLNGAREIAVSDLSNGMYIMQLTGPGYSVVHRKVIVMNRN